MPLNKEAKPNQPIPLYNIVSRENCIHPFPIDINAKGTQTEFELGLPIPFSAPITVIPATREKRHLNY